MNMLNQKLPRRNIQKSRTDDEENPQNIIQRNFVRLIYINSQQYTNFFRG